MRCSSCPAPLSKQAFCKMSNTVSCRRPSWTHRVEQEPPPDSTRERGGAPRKPAPRNHIWGGLPNHAQMICTKNVFQSLAGCACEKIPQSEHPPLRGASPACPVSGFYITAPSRARRKSSGGAACGEPSGVPGRPELRGIAGARLEHYHYLYCHYCYCCFYYIYHYNHYYYHHYHYHYYMMCCLPTLSKLRRVTSAPFAPSGDKKRNLFLFR